MNVKKINTFLRNNVFILVNATTVAKFVLQNVKPVIVQVQITA